VKNPKNMRFQKYGKSPKNIGKISKNMGKVSKILGKLPKYGKTSKNMGKLPNIYLGGTLIGCQECLVFWVPKLGPV
jgi:hypothetical protein